MSNPTVTFLDGIILKSTPATVRILAALDNASELLGIPVQITSAAEPLNPPRLPTDPHPNGRAIDVRTNGLASQDILKLYHALGNFLGPVFTVLFEGPAPYPDPAVEAIRYLGPSKPTGFHIHVQVAIGKAYPPVPVVTTIPA